MQEITVTPLEALAQLKAVASLIDTAECKDEAMYNELQGALVVAQTALAMAPKQEAQEIHCQEFHELAMDYRGASPLGAIAAYDALCKYVNQRIAAPAAANGALTDEKAMEIAWEFQAGGDDGKFTFLAADLPGMFRAILAAAGPDAALIKALEEVIVADWPACNPGCDYEDPYGGMHDHRSKICVCEAAKESIARQRAALSGAKGN